jgi:hypothetical protein
VTRSLPIAVCGLLALAVALAAVQLTAFGETVPAPDSIAYFEVADQVQRVGYAKALSLHWSPLYPLFLGGLRAAFPSPGDGELWLTAAGDAFLAVAVCLIVAAASFHVSRLCWPGSESRRRGWAVYTCGLALFFAFAVFRVGLRLPDVLVTCFVVAALWSWCNGLARRADWRWAAAAGAFSGLAFLTRSNLLHWSLAVAAAACALAPAAPRRRFGAFAAFLAAMTMVVGPHVYVLSAQRGRIAFGESGKLVFAETYGASWPGGVAAWPERVSGGDVRVFTETREVAFPGFYEPGREYEDATVPFSPSLALWSVVRSSNACLNGYWTPSFALLWPILWASWPLMLFGSGRRTSAASEAAHPRVPIARLLIVAGAAGIGMHLLSFCVGYYLPPYLLPLLSGLYLLAMDAGQGSEGSDARLRAPYIVAAGFAVAAMVVTLGHLRGPARQGRAADLAEARAMASALEAVPHPGPGLRKVAVAGEWLGLYGVRLAKSQVLADIPDLQVLRSRNRLERAVGELRRLGVTALIVPSAHAGPRHWPAMTPVPGGRWSIADLRSSPSNSHENSGS